MAHFYGVVRGQARTEATRCGSRRSGMTTIAASWEGSVLVELCHRDGADFVRVTLGQWRGEGQCPEAILYDGPVNPERTSRAVA